jgi:6-pyruvoyltetrahydropterin/6-carboxytetrahydropterin synthase
MYTVRVETDFAAAHFLSHYHGKCERLHGHNYRVRLWARGESLDDGGMVIDFALLKKTLRQAVSPLDHTNLNDLEVFENDPSAERIAKYIYDQCAHLLGGKAGLLLAADVYETPGSMARYSPSPNTIA